MTSNKLGAKLDAGVSAAAERTLRKLTRRDALRAAIASSVAGIAALSLGQRPAWARSSTARCSSCPKSGSLAYCCGPTYRCSHYKQKCPSHGCPKTHRLCKSSGDCAPGRNHNRQGYYCEWAAGSWIACNGAGKHGHGYYVCYDCVGPGGCIDWCTCLGDCVCCDCKTADDVRAEHKRLQSLQGVS